MIVLGVAWYLLHQSFTSPDEAAEFIRNLGWIGPFVVILFIIMEVIVAPIPGSVIAVASGYAFGPFMGVIYSYTGNVIGSVIAFYLARRFGRTFIAHFISRKQIDQYDAFITSRGNIVIWLAYLFPVLPSDLVSFASGLSDISYRKFITIVCLGYLPNMILLNYFGYALFDFGFGRQTILTGIAILILVVTGYLLYQRMRHRAHQRPK